MDYPCVECAKKLYIIRHLASFMRCLLFPNHIKSFFVCSNTRFVTTNYLMLTCKITAVRPQSRRPRDCFKTTQQTLVTREKCGKTLLVIALVRSRLLLLLSRGDKSADILYSSRSTDTTVKSKVKIEVLTQLLYASKS